MATIRREIIVAASPDAVWSVIRDVGAVHTRLAPGFVLDTRLEAGARVVTFANGLVVREIVVGIDERSRRLAYRVAEGVQAEHHHASFEVLPHGPSGTRLVWITDVLPDTIAPDFEAMIEEGSAVIRRTLTEQLS